MQGNSTQSIKKCGFSPKILVEKNEKYMPLVDLEIMVPCVAAFTVV
jgi:hypothetical protein